MRKPGDLPARVLYIEDHTESKLLVTRLLETEGCEVITCSDGIRGLELALTLRPDLILVDLNLPFMDGYETATRFRMSVHRLQGSVPVVATSIYALHEEREMAIAAGCDGFIAKPYDVDTFVEDVSRYHMGRRDAISPERERSALIRYHQRLVEKLEARAAAVLMDEDTLTYNEAYLSRRLEEEASRSVRLRDAFSIVVVALDITSADHPADIVEERRVVHRSVVEILRSSKRAFDVIARIGEDAFCLFFGGCGPEHVELTARRICLQLIERLPAVIPKGINAAVSYGVNSYSGGSMLARPFLRKAADRLTPVTAIPKSG